MLVIQCPFHQLLCDTNAYRVVAFLPVISKTLGASLARSSLIFLEIDLVS